MQSIETVRVSNRLLSWLDDPSSVPTDAPFCSWCRVPKIERNKRCEICGEYSAVTGPQPPKGNVFVEVYKSNGRKVTVRRNNGAAR